MKQRLLPMVILAAAMTISVRAQDLSGIPASFVDIGFGARAVSMGGAYTGLSNDAYAVLWNPAGMTAATTKEVAFSYTDHLGGMLQYQHLAAVIPIGVPSQSVGIAAISSGDDALRELTIQAAYARRFSIVSVGAAVKYRMASFGDNVLSASDYVVFSEEEIAEGLANQVSGSASGFGLDVGVMIHASEQATFGIKLRDAVAPLNWDSQSANPDKQSRGSYNEALPMELAIGASYKALANTIVSLDYAPAIEDDAVDKIRGGLEMTFLDMVSLRGGMQHWVNAETTSRYSLGLGLHVPVGDSFVILANYSYLFETIEDAQHISLAVQF